MHWELLSDFFVLNLFCSSGWFLTKGEAQVKTAFSGTVLPRLGFHFRLQVSSGSAEFSRAFSGQNVAGKTNFRCCSDSTSGSFCLVPAIYCGAVTNCLLQLCCNCLVSRLLQLSFFLRGHDNKRDFRFSLGGKI